MARPVLPICVKCNLEMRPDTNGVTVVLMAYDPPQPYESYRADLVKCPKCNNQIITGYSQNAIWRNFHEEPAPDITAEKIFPSYEKIKDSPSEHCAGCGNTDNLTECRATPEGTYHLCPRCLVEERQA